MIRIEKSNSGNWVVVFKTEDTAILLSSDKSIRLSIIEASKRLSIVATVKGKDGRFEASCGVLRLKSIGGTPTLARDNLKQMIKRELDRLPMIS